MLFLCVLFLLDFSGSLHVERTKELYRDLLSIFDKLILPTHASCHVQYILFYLCSFKLVSLPHTVILIHLKKRNINCLCSVFFCSKPKLQPKI